MTASTAVSALVSAAASAASHQLPTLDSLLCRSLPALYQQLTPGRRIASLDVTSSHISIALSDETRRSAAPFGILARTKNASIDAKILTSAMTKVSEFEKSPLQITGLIIGVPPISGDQEAVVTYARALLKQNVGLPDVLFPDLKACLFYSEAHALLRAVSGHRDYINAMRLLPPNLETKKLRRIEAALYPKVPTEELIDDMSVEARISASEILQAVLDKLESLDRNENTPHKEQ